LTASSTSLASSSASERAEVVSSMWSSCRVGEARRDRSVEVPSESAASVCEAVTPELVISLTLCCWNAYLLVAGCLFDRGEDLFELVAAGEAGGEKAFESLARAELILGERGLLLAEVLIRFGRVGCDTFLERGN